MLKDHGWSWKRCVPHGGHQMSLAIAAGLGLGRKRELSGCVSSPLEGFPTAPRSATASCNCRTCLGSAFEGKSDLYSVMRELAA